MSESQAKVSSKRRERERRPARREAQIAPLPLILVVCEGKVTEPAYLNGFRAWCKNPRVTVRIAGAAGVPLTLVELAKELKELAEQEARREADDNLLYEQVWCVFDVDEHPKVREARQLATQHGLQLAVSNPCFELWLLLHLRDSPGMRHRHDVQHMLRDLMPGKDKHIDFEKLIAGYAEAVSRASRLDKEAAEAGEDGRSPTTGVYRVTMSIAGSSQKPKADPERDEQSRAKAEAAAREAWEQAERELAAAQMKTGE